MGVVLSAVPVAVRSNGDGELAADLGEQLGAEVVVEERGELSVALDEAVEVADGADAVHGVPDHEHGLAAVDAALRARVARLLEEGVPERARADLLAAVLEDHADDV